VRYGGYAYRIVAANMVFPTAAKTSSQPAFINSPLWPLLSSK
jgi:hypothetical protein